MPKSATGVSATHFLRYIKHKCGMSPDEIAVSDNVKIKAVQRSIQHVEIYRKQHTLEFLNEAIIKEVMSAAPELGKALVRALTAKTEGQDGEFKEDIATQLKGVHSVSTLVRDIQPKGSGTHVQVGIQNQNAPTVISHNYLGFEDRLRKLRPKIDQVNALPSETVSVNIENDEVIEAGTEAE